MRIFVFLLIVANLLFLAWAQGYFGTPANPDADRVTRQLQPERLTIVARDEPPPLPPVKPEVPPVKPEVPPVKPEPVAVKPPISPEVPAAEVSVGNSSDNSSAIDTGNGGVGGSNGGNGQIGVSSASSALPVCLLLADLPPADAEKFEAVLADRFATFKVKRTAVAAGGSYWVNIPPLASRQEAEAKVAELKRLGVVEYFIVQEAGPNNLAISLGLYSRRPAAETHFETLRGKGVKSARITERNVRAASVTLEIDGPGAGAVALRQAIAENLPESEAAPCKTGTTSGR